MQQDSTDGATSTKEEMKDTRTDEPVPTVSDLPADAVAPTTPPAMRRIGHFDWPAVGAVVIIGAIFAALAHLSAQPYASLVPAAVLSATGCGLLITGLRKLRTFKGAGIFEAALSGLLLALFQFVSALSFPGVTRGLSVDQASRAGFYTTWVLVAIFATLFSMIGAALGHLAFAPPRPLPARAGKRGSPVPGVDADDVEESAPRQDEDLPVVPDEEDEREESEEPAPLVEMETVSEEAQPAGSRMSSIISIVLLGLAPFLAGYVFAAAFDVALNFNRYDPGPFPTLRLLSGLLPWQVPLPVDLQSLNLVLAWRIPLSPGNPTAFDIQTLEPFLLNAAGLACTLLAVFRLEKPEGQTAFRSARRNALLMEALLGLALVLPANLWIAFGLHGLLQLSSIAVLLRTLQLLNPLTFTLNLITAPLICVIAGAVIFGIRRNSTNYHR
jgi:hypothetical protein